MLITPDKYIDFLVKNNLTEHQFLICYLIYTKDVKNIIKYNKKFRFNREQIMDLIDKDFIIPILNEEAHLFDLLNLNVTAKYYDEIISDEDDAEIVWNLYPSYLMISNIKVYSKSSMLKEDFFKFYLKSTKRNKKTHSRIVTVIEKHYKNKYAEMGIDKFIGTEYWKELEKDNKNGGSQAGTRFV